MAATTQIVAALVRPTTAPRAWSIVPAPMNPTPATICAPTRGGLLPRAIAPAALSIASERCVYRTEPTQIRMFVRSPAGLPPSSRSKPIAPPNRTASPICSISCSRKISTIWLNTLEESHFLAYLRDRPMRERARSTRAIAQAIEYARGFALQFRRALAHRRQRLVHVVRQHALAVEAAPPRRPALLRDLRDGALR